MRINADVTVDYPQNPPEEKYDQQGDGFFTVGSRDAFDEYEIETE
jgi:hypothetical protein